MPSVEWPDREQYEEFGDPAAEWVPSRRDERKQRQSEEIREAARAAAAKVPPLSDRAIEDLSRLLRVQTPPHDLVRWQLRLFCGHLVERTAHRSHKAFKGSTRCPKCDRDPAVIVAAKVLGPVAGRSG